MKTSRAQVEPVITDDNGTDLCKSSEILENPCNSWLDVTLKKQQPAETSNQAVTRIPMRNHQEGYFARWHTDLGYPNLYPGLRRLYPDHSTLPEPTAVLQWQQDYQNWVELLRADYAIGS